MRLVLLGLAVCTVATGLTVMTTGAVAVDEQAPASALGDQGELRIEVVDGDSGRPLATRARIVPARLWRDERVLVDRHGHMRTTLAPGSYRVSITHGPEWSVFEQTLTIEPGRASKLEARLTRAVDASRYTACDLHVHTAESPDSNLDLHERISTLLAEDVQFVVLTDHNRVTQAGEALRRVGIGSLPGVEVTTWDPELGHFNVFPRHSAPRYRHPDAAHMLTELRRDPGSFVQMNHPRLEGHIGYFELLERQRARGEPSTFPLAFDAIEVWNGYDLASPARRDEVFRDWLTLLDKGQHITATGNSDSHKAGLAPYVGYPRTYVHVPRAQAGDPFEVLAALRQGRAFVTNGPLLNVRLRNKQPGETVQLARGEHRVSVLVELDAPPWMALSEVELWLGNQRAAVRSLPPGQGPRSVRMELPVGSLRAARSLVATVRGGTSMKPLLGRAAITPYAFTNPVWIERR
jgi:predicted metal-dependent phosphoesterase TrpH